MQLKRFLRRLCGHEGGAGLVEFAMVAPVLILFLLGIVEAALMLFLMGEMENVGRHAARSVAIGEFTEQQAADYIQGELSNGIGSPQAEIEIVLNSGSTELESEVVATITIPGSQLEGLTPAGIVRPSQLVSTVSVPRQ